MATILRAASVALACAACTDPEPPIPTAVPFTVDKASYVVGEPLTFSIDDSCGLVPPRLDHCWGEWDIAGVEGALTWRVDDAEHVVAGPGTGDGLVHVVAYWILAPGNSYMIWDATSVAVAAHGAAPEN
jgi:hypothetical protein